MNLIDKPDRTDQYAAPAFNDSNWLDVTLGAWEMQLPAERDMATYPVTLWYRTTFDLLYLPPSLGLLIDGFSGSKYRLFINGKKVNSKGKRSSLDAEIRRVEIGKYVQDGKNSVAVQLTVQRRTDGILDLLKITGDFSLKKSGKGLSYCRAEEKIKDR